MPMLRDYAGPDARMEYGDMQLYDQKLDPTGGPPFISRRKRKMDNVKLAFVMGFFDELEKVGAIAPRVRNPMTAAQRAGARQRIDARRAAKAAQPAQVTQPAQPVQTGVQPGQQQPATPQQPPAQPVQPAAKSAVGGILGKAKDLLGRVSGWAEKNPTAAMMGTQGVMGVGQQWMQQRHERKMQQQQQGYGPSHLLSGGAVV